jgi:hypothetical protein
MKYPIILILLICSCESVPKNPFYEEVELGKYKVGYFDTLAYDMEQPYKQYGYDGLAPLFIQVWHPLKKPSSQQYLTYKDFSQRKLPESLHWVYAELCKQMDESFIAYNIAEYFDSLKAIDYGQYTYNDVLNDINTFTTKSVYSRLNMKNNYPVILYHHGSQGLSDENFIMAEYFASRGYIFISANYHLPYENLSYGFTEAFSDRSTEWPKIIAKLANELTNNEICFYIGHSWGAQIGFRHLYEKGWADAFVSLETTIEPKTDSLEIKDKWPEVYNTIRVQGKKYSMPILMFGGNEKQNPFPFFEDISDGKETVYYASTKKEFGHESYTSAYLLRYFYREKYKQPDSLSMKSQVCLYNKHLELIHSFFESTRTNQPLETEPFKKDFYFH